MKKICIILCFVLMLCSFEFASYANDFDFLKTAESVKQKVDIPENYTDFSSYIDIGSSINTILSWSGGDSNDGGVVTVVTDNMDRIIALSQYKYGKYEGNSNLSSIDYNKACEIATGYAQKIAPEFFDKLVLLDRPNHILRNNENYNVIFYRYENGFPCYDNYVIFLIDAYTKEISEYRAIWEDYSKISPAGKYITAKEALRRFNGKIGLELAYRNIDGKIKLVYSTNADGTKFVSAYNGNIVNTNLLPQQTAENYVKNVDFENPLYHTGMMFDLPENEEKHIRENKYFSITDDYVKSGSEIYVDNEENAYVVVFYESVENKPVTVILDMESLDIAGFSGPRAKSEESRMYSDFECMKKATDFVKTNMKSYYKDCSDVEKIITEDKNIYKVKFVRYVNNIPYNDNGIIIEIDRADGCVISAKSRIDKKAKFPLSIPDVSISEAYDILVKNAGFEIQYVSVKASTGTELVAVYGFSPVYPLYVCGNTGMLCDKDGNVYHKPFEKEYSDIKNSPSYTQIKTLSLARIMNYESGLFEPEKIVTYSEFAEIINNAFGVMPEIKQGNITHEEAINILVECLGYKELADLSDTYADVYVDCGSINEKYHGSAVIAKGLGIVNGNAFLPKMEVTRAYLAEVIYNTLMERDVLNEN